MNQTLQRTHQCKKEDNNPHHQQQQGAKHDYINIDDLLQDMGGSDGGGVGDDEQDNFWGMKMQRFLKTWLTIWTKMTFYSGI